MFSSFIPNPFPHAHSPSLCFYKGSVYGTFYGYNEEETQEAKILVSKFNQSLGKWTVPEVPFPHLSKSQGNPLLFTDGEKLYLLFVILEGAYWNSARVYCSCFNDFKSSWEEPLVTLFKKGMMIRHRPKMTMEGPQSQLLLPTYNELDWQSFLHTSKPPFTDWQQFSELSKGPIQGDLYIKNSNEMSIYLRTTEKDRAIHRMHSSDGGKTWPFHFKTTMPCPLSGIAFENLYEGIQVMCYNDTTEHQRTPLTIAFSDDGFKSLKAKVNIEEGPGEFSYPSLLVDQANILHLLYTHQRIRIGHRSFNQSEVKSLFEQQNG